MVLLHDSSVGFPYTVLYRLDQREPPLSANYFIFYSIQRVMRLLYTLQYRTSCLTSQRIFGIQNSKDIHASKYKNPKTPGFGREVRPPKDPEIRHHTVQYTLCTALSELQYSNSTVRVALDVVRTYSPS